MNKKTGMVTRILVWTGLIVMAGVLPVSAQARVEISGFAGWAFSDGVDGDPQLGIDGNFYDRVDPKDSATFGFTFGVLAGDNAEVGFMFGRQASTLVADGTNQREIGDMDVSTYHGYFGYNWGDPDGSVRPFFFGGLGATTFGEVTGAIAGQTRTISSETQFSTTWGARGKALPGAERRPANRAALDTYLHQERRWRMVVRSLVWLLSGRKCTGTRISSNSTAGSFSGSDRTWRAGGRHRSVHHRYVESWSV